MADDRLDASGDVTRLLDDYAHGNDASLNEVVPIVYQELKNLARAQLRRSGVRDRMETTALVHEAYEKLVAGKTQTARNRRHFFAIASRAMRQIVVDSYRAEHAAKRGGGAVAESLMTDQLAAMAGPEGVVAFDRAVARLAAESPELAELVDLSCFGGLSTAEIAALTDTTARTVQRNLGRARAWVGHFLGEAAG
jgi:RNA polymerase sigma factor (TIGR02999 family)